MIGDNMIINIQSLEKNSSKLIKSIDDFSNNISNIYNELNWVSGYWNDYHARLFFTSVESERIKINKTYDELVLLKEVYKYIISQYKSIGNKLKDTLETKDDLLNKFKLFYDKVNEIISLYYDLDLSNYCTVTTSGVISIVPWRLVSSIFCHPSGTSRTL